MRFINDIIKYRGYIRSSASAQLHAELADFRLGWLWWILEPTLNMLLYMFVFTVVFRRTTKYVVAFILVGLIYWRFFSTVVQSSVTLVKRYRSVLSKVYIPKVVLLLILMRVCFFKFLCAFVPLIPLMFYYRIPLSLNMLCIIPVTLVMWLLTFGISCLTMHLGVYVGDLSKVVSLLLQAGFYASGVFYSLAEYDNARFANFLLTFNPIAQLLYEARNALLYNIPCYWHILGIYLVLALVLSVVGIRVLYRNEGQYIKVV